MNRQTGTATGTITVTARTVTNTATATATTDKNTHAATHIAAASDGRRATSLHAGSETIHDNLFMDAGHVFEVHAGIRSADFDDHVVIDHFQAV